jgi:hypothetical protein
MDTTPYSSWPLRVSPTEEKAAQFTDIRSGVKAADETESSAEFHWVGWILLRNSSVGANLVAEPLPSGIFWFKLLFRLKPTDYLSQCPGLANNSFRFYLALQFFWLN